MSLTSRAEDLVMWSSFFAFIMFLLAIVSIVTMVSYLWDGSVDAWVSVGGCMVGMFLILIMLCVTTIPVALRVAKESWSASVPTAVPVTGTPTSSRTGSWSRGP